MRTHPRATIDALRRVPEHGKAELVNGELVLMSPTGARPNRAAGNVYISLRKHEKLVGGGFAYSDNAGFLVACRGDSRSARTPPGTGARRQPWVFSKALPSSPWR